MCVGGRGMEGGVGSLGCFNPVQWLHTEDKYVFALQKHACPT